MVTTLYGTADRETAFERLQEPWDVVIVGGGITGAGILREGVRSGLRIVLLEQNDFASGTSSRSSKLVHGGLRYLNHFQFELTRQSVLEREKLLSQGPGLVEPLPFLFPTYEHDAIPGWMMAIGLRLYAWLGGRWRVHEELQPQDVVRMVPGLSTEHLTGGFWFVDAQTDDARLVLRVIREGAASGNGIAINYARVERLLFDTNGQVNGVTVRDQITDRSIDIRAKVVVNATGVWADRLREQVAGSSHIRPLRGSHLIFSRQRFSLNQAVSFPHPDDGRPVFVFPWEGVTLLGTTDLDHGADLDEEPRITPDEVTYLLRAVQAHFPDYRLTEKDIRATFAGVRPVISHGQDADPSKESREHAVWEEQGLLTVTGGKLTTFRNIALDVLKQLSHHLPQMLSVDERLSALDPVPAIDKVPDGLTEDQARRLVARYGADILAFAAHYPARERETIDGLPIHWLELRWAARHEAVQHLDDLLLRRVRLGLLTPRGGEAYLRRIRTIVKQELGWNGKRWREEASTYRKRWLASYSPPKISTV